MVHLTPNSYQMTNEMCVFDFPTEQCGLLQAQQYQNVVEMHIPDWAEKGSLLLPVVLIILPFISKLSLPPALSVLPSWFTPPSVSSTISKSPSLPSFQLPRVWKHQHQDCNIWLCIFCFLPGEKFLSVCNYSAVHASFNVIVSSAPTQEY